MRWIRPFVVVIALALLPQAVAAAGDPQAFRQIIQDQLDAFQRDDGVAAFAHASPMIKDMFRTPDHFMRMVVTGYPQVYRPRSVTFGGTTTYRGQPTQIVYLTGADGDAVVAYYQMQQQVDGTWKINGVDLEPAANA